jgi:hypothetical protein
MGGDTDPAEETTSFKTPFGREVDMREAHLDALPGKVFSEYLDSLNRASQVFTGNSLELEQHLRQFVGTPMHVRELPDNFDDEVNRLLHNYLASLATLRDVQRMVHRKLWTERHAPDSKDDKRTAWEVKIWEPKRDELFGDDVVKFLVDLRNYSMHYAIPLSSSGTTVSWNGSGPVVQENAVRLNRLELLKWDGWKGASRRHIESHDGDIEFLPAIADYSLKVRDFYGWFWEQVLAEVRVDLDEYHGKTNEYNLWRKVEGTFSHFGPDGRSVYRPRLAAARLERAAYGTKGWRPFTPDENGEWVVGESDWGPLPEGPR